MHSRVLLPTLLFSSALTLVAAAPGPAVSAGAASSDAGNYAIDPVHSSVIFKVDHLDLAPFHGRFNRIGGEFTLAEDAAASKVRVEIETASVDTANKGRDDHVKGPDFLDVLQYPKAVFESTKVVAKGDDYTITGKLELHGKSREVTLRMTKTGARDVGEQAGGYKVGFEGSMSFDRKDFGIGDSFDEKMLGGEIELLLGIEASRQ